MGVTVDASQLVDRLERIGRNARNLREVMPRLGAILMTHVDDYVQSEGNGSWPGFSPATLIRNPRRRGGMLLQDTGLLANFQMDARATSVEVFSPAPYAKFHVLGTSRMPKRDPTKIKLNAVLDEMMDVLQQEVTR